MTALEVLKERLDTKLIGIAELLPNTYRLTLVARHRGKASANIILSDDNLDSAIQAIRAMQNDPRAEVYGPAEPEL